MCVHTRGNDSSQTIFSFSLAIATNRSLYKRSQCHCVMVIESGIGGGKGELAGARLNAGETESSSEGYGRSEG
jgi:hypothetical protein